MEICACTDVYICVCACVYTCLLFFFFPLTHSLCYKRGGLREKGAHLTSVGYWLQILTIYPQGVPLKVHWYLLPPPPTPCCHPASLRQAPPSHPFPPTPLLLCGYAAVHTTPGLFGPAQQPQAGFISKNSLLTTSTHSRACGLPKLKVLYRWYLNKAGTHLYFLDHKDPHFDLQSILSLWFSKHSLALSYLF